MSKYILEYGFTMAILIYSFLYDKRLLGIYFGIIGVYTIIHYMIKDDSHNGVRTKLRLATWSGGSGPEIYFKHTIALKPFEEFAAKKLKEGVKITLSHVACKAIAHALSIVKGINGKLIFGKFVQHEDVAVNTLVDVDGTDLVQNTFRKMDKKSITEIAVEMREIIIAIKSKRNKRHAKKTVGMNIFPDWFVSIQMELATSAAYNFDFNLSYFDSKKEEFGTVLLTNISALGYREAYVPLADFTRNIACVCLCEPHQEMTCDDDGTNQRMEKVFNWMQTTDHRFLDGAFGSVLQDGIKEVWANPAAFDKTYEELNKEHRYMSTPRERKEFLKSKDKTK